VRSKRLKVNGEIQLAVAVGSFEIRSTKLEIQSKMYYKLKTVNRKPQSENRKTRI